MSKLSKEDEMLWNSYKLNISKIIKKNNVNLYENKEKSIDTKHLLSDKLVTADNSFIKLLKKKRISIEAHIDLHGLKKVEAKIQVVNFIRDSFHNKIRHILIITGKGNDNNGVLKSETPKWLNEEGVSKFVVAFSNMPKSLGGEGAIYVKLKNVDKYTNKL